MKMNLKSLLDDTFVEIPALQRNYVHGADSPQAEEIRKHFLGEYIKLLNGTKDEFNLNFIYGERKGSIFFPVDGQQRLTTLWLLAAYVANQNDIDLQKREWLDRLERFSYTGRPLASFASKCIANGAKSEQLQNTECCSDITAAAMIWTLKTFENNIEIKQYSFEQLSNALDRIVFELEEINQSAEETYIKMNARGKTLTQWENFKGKFSFLLGPDLMKEWNKSVETFTDNYIESQEEGKPLQDVLPDIPFFSLVARLLLYEVCKNLKEEDKKYTIDSLPNLSKLAVYSFKGIFPFVPFDEFQALKMMLKSADTTKTFDDIVRGIIKFIGDVFQQNEFYNNNYFPYWDSEQKETLWETIFKPDNKHKRDFGFALYEYAKRFEPQPHPTYSLAIRLMTNIIENDTSEDYIKHCIAFFKNGARLYGEQQIDSLKNSQMDEEIQKGRIYSSENKDIIRMMQNLEVSLQGRIRIAILDLSNRDMDQRSIEFPLIHDRIENTQKWLDKWIDSSEEERINIFFDEIVPRFDWKIQSEVLLNFDADGLMRLICSNNDECLQRTLVDGKPSRGVENTSYDVEGGRDWREVLRNPNKRYLFQVCKKIKWHTISGRYYLYSMETIKYAFPISDYRIDVITDDIFAQAVKSLKPNSPSREDDLLRMDDLDTTSFPIQKGLMCYFYRDRITVVAYNEQGRQKVDSISYNTFCNNIPCFLEEIGKLTYEGFEKNGFDDIRRDLFGS